MVKPRLSLRNLSGANSAWIGVGAPIIGLVLIVMALAFTLVSNFARQQDEAFVESSQNLVGNAMRERVQALKNIAIDFAVWNDAYNATNGRAWNARWIASNYYSNIADGLFILGADGELRYDWVAEPQTSQRDEVIVGVTHAFRATDIAALSQRAAKDHVAFTSFVLVAGHPAIVSIAQIAPEGRPQRTATPGNYLAVVDVLGDGELGAAGAALELHDFTFATGAPDNRRVVASDIESLDGASIGALTWRRERPGSAAFIGEIWPIALCLSVIGVLTLLVARELASAHVRATVQTDAAREASRLKSEFIATMSHELRTPLNTIVGYAELIQEQAESLGASGETIGEDAEHVLDGAKHLGRLVNNILDQSRIDAGRLQLASEAIEVAEILTELQELMLPMAQANGNAFVIESDDDIGVVRADPVRLQQCLINLTSNALKFTRGGEVRVIASRVAQGDLIQFEIRDTGIGIEHAELDRLFQPFPTPNNIGAGTGLSLSITRSLARLMGGDVIAQSELGEGSTFRLTLPAAKVRDRAAA